MNKVEFQRKWTSEFMMLGGGIVASLMIILLVGGLGIPLVHAAVTVIILQVLVALANLIGIYRQAKRDYPRA